MTKMKTPATAGPVHLQTKLYSWHLPCERWATVYKKSMPVPMNKWWADEDCCSSCPICTLMKPLKWLKLSGKKWTVSLITPATEASVWTLLNSNRWTRELWYCCSVITRGCSWFCTKSSVKLIAELTGFLFLRGSTRALSQFDFHWSSPFLGTPLSSNQRPAGWTLEANWILTWEKYCRIQNPLDDYSISVCTDRTSISKTE